MATESGFNPIPVLVHLVAIALGVYLGLVAMDAIAPDLPGEDVDPGVSSSAAPGSVAGDDPASLLRAANLAPALDQLAEQVGAGQGIRTLHIEPGSLDAETASGDELLAPGDVPVGVPTRLAAAIDEERGGITLADIAYTDLVVTEKGPRWYVQLDISRDIGPPPWTYGAPLKGAPLSAGPAPPVPVEG